MVFSTNQGFRFGLDDMIINTTYGDFDLSVSLGDGITVGNSTPDGSGKWLTQSDMDTIIYYAKSKDIEIVPELDMPSHMGCILKDFPDFKLENRCIDIKNERSVDFAIQIFLRYINYFKSKGLQYVMLGGDEMPVPYNDAFNYYYSHFINRLCHIATTKGIVPLIYNDYIGYGGENKYNINNGVIVAYWEPKDTSATTKVIDRLGFNLINTGWDLYWVLGGSSVAPQPTLESLELFDPYTTCDGIICPNVSGAMFCIWCDKGITDGADDGNNVMAVTLPLVEKFGSVLPTKLKSGYLSALPTLLRPPFPLLGQSTFDTTLNKPIWYTGTAWVDATGTIV